MRLARKGRLTAKPQKPTWLFLDHKQIESQHRKAKKNGPKLDEDIERMIEAKVALALRLMKT